MIKITNDVFDICKRIKEIDEGYEIFYCTEKQRFEVHKGGELQSVLPFDKLDARTVLYLRKTRVENCLRLIEEIDNKNLEITSAIENEFKDKRNYKVKNLIGYLEKNKSYVPSYDEI